MTMSYAPLQWLGRTTRIPKSLRDLSLLQQFAIIMSPLLVLGTLGIGIYVVKQVEEGVVRSVASTAALYSKSLFEPHVQDLRNANSLSQPQHDQLDMHLSRQLAGGSIIGIRLWKNDTIAYSDDKSAIGKEMPPDLLRTKAKAGTVSFIYTNGKEFIGQSFPSSALWKNVWSDAETIDEEHLWNYGEFEKRSHGRPVLEIYAPVRETGSDRIIAVVETHQVPPALGELLAAAHLETWVEIGSMALFSVILPAVVVRRGSKTIDRQRTELERRVHLLSELLTENTGLHRKCNLASQRVSDVNEKFLRRLGADLHDGPVQLIGMSLLRLDSLDHIILTAGERPYEEAQDDIMAIRDALKESLEELRHVSSGLVPPDIENMTIEGLIGLVARKHERRTRMPVKLNIGPLPDSPTYSLKVCIYRLTQEGLTNALHHARGQGQSVEAHYVGNILSITISDTGPGLIQDDQSRTTERQGLTGLRDRVEALGGNLSIVSRPGHGTRLTARFTIDEGLA